MDKNFIIIGNRNTGISTITKDLRDKKINECLNCKREYNKIIVCSECVKMFDDIKIVNLKTKVRTARTEIETFP